MSVLAWILLAAVESATPLPSAAERCKETFQDADAAYRSGVELRKQQSEATDRKALEAFRCANALKPEPRTLGQMAFAEQALGDWQAAERHARQALESEDDPWVETNVEHLKSTIRLADEKQSTLVVSGKPPGATVTIDGKLVGRLGPAPLSLKVPLGVVDLQVRAEGYEPHREQLEISKPSTEAKVELEQIEPEVAPSASEAPQPTPVEPFGREDKRSYVTEGVVAAVGAGLFLGAGGLFHKSREDSAKQFNSGDCGTKLENSGAAGCRSLQNEVSRFQVMAGVSYGLGLGLVGLSVYLLSDSPDSEQTRQQGVSCAPSLLNPGLSCKSRF